MKKENFDEKLTAFLRSNTPDVPKESPEFEERLLNATVRTSWRYRLNILFQFKWRYAFSISFAALLIFVAVSRQSESEHRNHTPMFTATHSVAPEISDEDVYSFLVESWNGIDGENSIDFLPEIESI